MKQFILIAFALISFNSLATTTVDVEIGCIIPGHGGGCNTKKIDLPNASGSYLEAEITEESCFDDGMCDFCTTHTISEYSSNNLNYLRLRMDEGQEGLKVKEGKNIIKIRYYEEHGLYEGSETIIVNVSIKDLY